jgi:hypothetical protein
MTGSTGSNPQTLVKPWSTWVITSKTWSASPNNPLDQFNAQRWSTLGQNPVKPHCPWAPSGTLAAFSKFHLNTPNSPNIKVVQFFEGHNFAFGWHCKFRVESGEKLGQLHILLFTIAMKTNNFACSSCSNSCPKHRSAFEKNTLL